MGLGLANTVVYDYIHRVSYIVLLPLLVGITFFRVLMIDASAPHPGSRRSTARRPGVLLNLARCSP